MLLFILYIQCLFLSFWCEWLASLSHSVLLHPNFDSFSIEVIVLHRRCPKFRSHTKKESLNQIVLNWGSTVLSFVKFSATRNTLWSMLSVLVRYSHHHPHHCLHLPIHNTLIYCCKRITQIKLFWFQCHHSFFHITDAICLSIFFYYAITFLLVVSLMALLVQVKVRHVYAWGSVIDRHAFQKFWAWNQRFSTQP